MINKLYWETWGINPPCDEMLSQILRILFTLTPWWRHQMETFSALLAICAGNSPVPSDFPAQRPVTRSFDVFFVLRLHKWLSKQSLGWWFETLSRPLWRHCNGYITKRTGLKDPPFPDNIFEYIFSKTYIGALLSYLIFSSCLNMS